MWRETRTSLDEGRRYLKEFNDRSSCDIILSQDIGQLD